MPQKTIIQIKQFGFCNDAPILSSLRLQYDQIEEPFFKKFFFFSRDQNEEHLPLRRDDLHRHHHLRATRAHRIDLLVHLHHLRYQNQ